jgi:hypothetical protein
MSHDSDYEARLKALEAQLARQAQEIRQLRKAQVATRLRAWLAPGIMTVLLLIVGAGGILPAAAQGGKGQESGAGPTATGGNFLLGQSNSVSSVNDVTRIYNPSTTSLMPLAFRISNYTSSELSINSNLRVAIAGTTSGVDNTGGTQRIGVLGMTDQNGYGVYGASAQGSGVYGASATAYGGEFSGGAAQIRLVPGVTAGPPSGSSHLTGELYLDSNGDLYLCTSGGASPHWAKLNLLASYLPSVMR